VKIEYYDLLANEIIRASANRYFEEIEEMYTSIAKCYILAYSRTCFDYESDDELRTAVRCLPALAMVLPLM